MKFKLFFFVLLLTVNISTETGIIQLIDSILQILLGGLNASLGDIDYSIYKKIGNGINTVGNVYDYIVVGSGTGGSSLASMLVKGGKSVLLLESGDIPGPTTEMPAFASLQQFTPQNWGYLMEQQDNVGLGMEGQLIAWPKGKVLGGSSEINMMVHTRGNKWDYDRWASAGNPGWSFNDLRQIFIENENAHLNISDPNYHGYSGPLDASDIPYRTVSCEVFVKSANESGYPYVDYNGLNQMGVSFIQGTIRNGRRCGAEKAFIRPIIFKPNFKLSLNSHVTKVLIHRNNKTAYGVEYVESGLITRTARARKEVILSAGTFHTPQILMLSGIGPKDHLIELGIEVIKDLPVGKKLYDHTVFMGLIWTVNSDIIGSFASAIASIVIWLASGEGPITSLSGLESLLFFKTSIATYSEEYPDIELIFLCGHINSDNGTVSKKMFRIKQEVYDKIWKPLEGKWTVGVVPLLLHPESVGHMKLRSKNPFDPPKLYGNYFTDSTQHDLRTFLAAIEESKRIMKASAFQKYNATLHNVPVPGCESHTFDSPPYWLCALRHLTVTLYHQTSTCKMGNITDQEAVVNHKLQVYGINNLRVADASVIPHPVSGHTNIPTYAVGTKGGYLILQDDP